MRLLRRPGWAVSIFLVGLAAIAPIYVLGKFPTLEWTYVWAFLIAILGLNILTGYCGQISLGHSAFMAVGGYTTAILVSKLGWNYLATLPLAALLAAVGGVILAIPALKLRGLYLGLATFALAISAPTVIRHFDTLSGGDQGISLPLPTDPFGWVNSGQLTLEQWLYYVALVLFLLLFLFGRSLLRSKVGRAFKAVRDSETAAVANGISLTYYKTLAFGISAFYAGIAGSLDALATAYVGPDSFDVNLALALVVGAVIGGLGTLVGPILGAIFVVWTPIYAQDRHLGALALARPDIVFGVLLILIMYTMPSGLAGGLFRLLAWYQKQRQARRGEPSPATRAGAESPAS